MDRAILEEKQRALGDQFEALNQEKAKHEKSASDIEAELFRLQGDFRTVQDLLSKLPPEGEVPTQDALSITAEKDSEEEQPADDESTES